MTADQGHGKLSWPVAAVFLVADLVGGGIVSMPVAFKHSGLYVGCLLMIVIAALFEYTGYQLGVVWVTLQERWPEYRQVCRRPFPEIALRSLGTRASRFTFCLVNVTLFGVSVVFLLLSSEIIHYFIDVYLFTVSRCLVIVALALILWPLTFLRSPSEFWPIVVLAMVSTVCAVSLIIWGVASDAAACLPHARLESHDIAGVFSSLGVFLFAFSGHMVFPTIQHDMRRPVDFSKSVVFGYLMVVLLYMPLSVLAYSVYGSSLSSQSVIFSIQTTWMQLGANGMIAAHCLLAFVILVNPVNQEAEEFFSVKHGFGVGRVVTRTCVLLSVLLAALTFPEMTPVMNLVGSFSGPVACGIMPSLFYLFTLAATEEEWRKGVIPSIYQVINRTGHFTLAINFVVIGVSLFTAVFGTYEAIAAFSPSKFQTPCYVRPFVGQAAEQVAVLVKQQCCGAFSNISIYGHEC